MISKLSKSIPPFYVMEVLERAKEIESSGENVIHLEIGEPDHNTAIEVCTTAISSINEGETKYTHSLGIYELRNELSLYYKRKYDVDISADKIIVTSGSSPALFLSFLSILNPGDEIILTNPHYACYPQIIRIAGGVPKLLNIYEEDGFQIDIYELKKHITKKTKAILINSPSNPTGMMLEPDIIKEISELGIFVISDEIYHGLVYEGQEKTILEYSKKSIVVNGFSKLFSMTGWRLGYLIVPEEFVRPIQKLQQNLFISANSFVQRAAIKALNIKKQKLDSIVGSYKKRRDLMLNGLNNLGFNIRLVPDGAFYIFANSYHINKNSYKLAFDILERSHVALTPGIDFGSGGEGYIRFSYANSEGNIKEGLNRLGNYLDNWV